MAGAVSPWRWDAVAAISIGRSSALLGMQA